jgi:chromosome segregation ATPase
MSARPSHGRVPRLLCAAAVVAGVLAPAPPAVAEDDPAPPSAARQRPVAVLLADLRTLHRQAGQAAEEYQDAGDRLRAQRAKADRLDAELARARLSLDDSRAAAGAFARAQYRSTAGALSPYLRVLFARDPQTAVEEGRLVARASRAHAHSVRRLTGGEHRVRVLARQARAALDRRLVLAAKRKKADARVRDKLGRIEELLAALTPGQLDALAAYERRAGRTRSR